MKFLFEFVYCCRSLCKEGQRIRAVAAGPCVEGEEWERRRWARRRRGSVEAGAAVEWKLSLCGISKDMVAVTVERVRGGGGEMKKKAAAADPALEQERSASRKRSGGSYVRVHDRGFNCDEYDQRRASFQVVILAFSPAPFMF
ncbi:hypothetical protein ACJRO7_025256 [Eucalyptus globulus]|uniref:Uncharacterized protein n=1 Tax=Eucalyptus globulus TaxID=34317 RepID=A0ABD3KEB0_EUCGL